MTQQDLQQTVCKANGGGGGALPVTGKNASSPLLHKCSCGAMYCSYIKYNYLTLTKNHNIKSKFNENKILMSKHWDGPDSECQTIIIIIINQPLIPLQCIS